MARLLKRLLACVAAIAMLGQAEKIEFINNVTPSGTTCYLENIGETIQGKK